MQIWDLGTRLVLHKMQFVIWIVLLTALPLVEVIEGDEKHHHEYHHNREEGEANCKRVLSVGVLQENV